MMSDDGYIQLVDLKPSLRPSVAGYKISKVPIIAVSPQSFQYDISRGRCDSAFPAEQAGSSHHEEWKNNLARYLFGIGN